MKKIFQASMLAWAASMAPAMATEVKVSGGKVAGLAMDDQSVIFNGIPYAAAPSGDRRWKPPAPRAPWSGVLDARKTAAACVQEDVGWNEGFRKNASEDCLSLSIRTPAPGAGSKLPVLVYIHGGMNSVAGAGSLDDDMIHRAGVVLVKIQYRLGVFGFLGLDTLRKEDQHRSSGNYALLDQIAALRWIKSNIAAFGGDPSNVTISGNSAGAADALFLTLSPLARGLYHKAILQAASPGAPRSARENEAIGDMLLDRLKLPRGAKGLAQLRALPPDVLTKAALRLPTPAGVDSTFLWEQQIVDGYVMPYAYGAAYAKGAGRGIPVIIGSNTQEIGADRKPEAAIALAASAFGANANAALALYGYKDGKAPPDDRVLGSIPTQLITDMWFRCPVNWLSERMRAATPKVWRYEFGFGAPGSGKPPEHTSEMNYVYRAAPANADNATWPPVQRYWVNFMRTGDPNGAGLPRWPAADDKGAYLSITPDGIEAGQAMRTNICKLMYQQRNYPQSPVAVN